MRGKIQREMEGMVRGTEGWSEEEGERWKCS